jgi:ABC-type Mn2+/Zn2+ transport system permease subunit
MTGLINLLFFLLVAATIVGAVWLSRKFKERFAEFPWWKAVVIIAVEVVAWVITVSFWHWVTMHPWIAIIAVAIILIVFIKKKKREEQIL